MIKIAVLLATVAFCFSAEDKFDIVSNIFFGLKMGDSKEKCIEINGNEETRIINKDYTALLYNNKRAFYFRENQLFAVLAGNGIMNNATMKPGPKRYFYKELSTWNFSGIKFGSTYDKVRSVFPELPKKRQWEASVKRDSISYYLSFMSMPMEKFAKSDKQALRIYSITAMSSIKKSPAINTNEKVDF